MWLYEFVLLGWPFKSCAISFRMTEAPSGPVKRNQKACDSRITVRVSDSFIIRKDNQTACYSQISMARTHSEPEKMIGQIVTVEYNVRDSFRTRKENHKVEKALNNAGTIKTE